MGITQIDCVTKEITYREFTVDEIAQKEEQAQETKEELQATLQVTHFSTVF